MTARASLALSLRRRVVRVPPRGVVGRVQDLADAGNELSDRLLDSLFQRDVRGAASLAAAAQPDVDVVLSNVDQLDEATAGLISRSRRSPMAHFRSFSEGMSSK